MLSGMIDASAALLLAFRYIQPYVIGPYKHCQKTNSHEKQECQETATSPDCTNAAIKNNASFSKLVRRIESSQTYHFTTKVPTSNAFRLLCRAR